MAKRESASARHSVSHGVWIGVGGGLLILASITAAAFLVDGGTGEAKAFVLAELARLESTGEPTSSASLDDYYKLPQGVENNTAHWRRGFAVPLDEQGIRDFLESPAGDPATANRLLHDGREALAAFHLAAEGGGAARFPVDYAAGYETELPHLSALRLAAKLLAVEARVALCNGDGAAAIRSIQGIFMAARAAENDPGLTAQFVVFAIHEIGQEEVRRALESAELPDQGLSLLQADLRRYDFRAALKPAFIGERAFGVDKYRGESGEIARWTECQRYLRWMGAVIESLDEPAPAAIQQALAVESEIGESAREGRLFDLMNKQRTLELIPAIETFLRLGARTEAIDRACDAAIAVYRFRRDRGRLPANVEELAADYLAAAPLDPCTGASLQFASSDDRLVIYGVGLDSKDDGGVDQGDGRPDMAFQFSLPHDE